MAASEDVVVVLDAGPLTHLDELSCLQLLEGFSTLLIPTLVWNEAFHHRPLLKIENIPGARLAAPLGPPPGPMPGEACGAELHAGEIAAITLLHESGGGILLSDDNAARRTAEALGFPVTGTLGLMLRGIRRGGITSAEVRAVAGQIRKCSTLHVSSKLLNQFVSAIP